VVDAGDARSFVQNQGGDAEVNRDGGNPADPGSATDPPPATDEGTAPVDPGPGDEQLPADPGIELVDDASVASHTLPASIPCDTTVSATVTLRNSGTTTWYRSGDDGYKLGYVGDGDHPFLPAGQAPRIYLDPGQTVPPDATVPFTVWLQAPALPGTLSAHFQMLLEGEHWFGAVAHAAIAITGDCSGSGDCAFPQGVPDEAFSGGSQNNPALGDRVNAVMRDLTGCNIGSTCSLSTYAGATADEKCQSWFAAVNAALRAQGLCAGLHEEGVTDEIAVSDTGCTGRWYGYHVCYYGGPTVVWSPGAQRGYYEILPAYCE
jgi:hypothetical protein